MGRVDHRGLLLSDLSLSVFQVTVDQYFFDEVYYVVDTVVDQLLKDPNRHFICGSAEASMPAVEEV